MEWYFFLLISFGIIFIIGFTLSYLRIKSFIVISFILQGLIISSLAVVETASGVDSLVLDELYLYWFSFWGITMQLICIIYISWFIIYQHALSDQVNVKDVIQFACIIWGELFFFGILICDLGYFFINGFDKFNPVDAWWLAPFIGGVFPAYYLQAVLGAILLIIGLRWAFISSRTQITIDAHILGKIKRELEQLEMK